MRYYIKFPGSTYALGPITANNKEEVIKFAREFAGLKKLPKGFEFWKADE